ncbi:type I methionyl aminopeptidase [Mesomycoplasma hyopneumoniae]|uniref:Methionine aminopeptidase n=1 Tax=Mesomycoplasma hyopneumoniae TaxID=2099 RepID=A0ABD4SWT1_MESHO|nr:type I methionyl aminopeptidase [Mesomycoplasma hyopneumoniae]AGQ50804.1 methionine aminopeptidase [Mesomycoplasma hyopneumoniae 7422]MCI8283214.1 type I methionyl aminopeptidase [Mesomycoplasma hyopneumoniae]MCI8298146.1 type I methionyl aminopeptidase [Mesomycoplasma hyopneumoniae]MXR35230.1 type I methionyl aminopeptidase [Mesomycoplasma hyopneumoniae]
MAIIKNEFEISQLKIAGKILAEVKAKIYDFVRPGISLKELDAIAFEEIKSRNAKPAFLNYHGFPATICASVNEILIHGIPSEYVIKENDLVSIDLGLSYNGFFVDSAFTKSLGPDQENQKLINCAKEAFFAGFKAIKPGAKTGDIGFAINNVIKSYGFFTPYEFSGHGIGKKLHEDPNIYNFGIPKKGIELVDNMVICIEPMILQTSPHIKILKDGWSVKAKDGRKTSHYEETILIKDGRGIILTEMAQN